MKLSTKRFWNANPPSSFLQHWEKYYGASGKFAGDPKDVDVEKGRGGGARAASAGNKAGGGSSSGGGLSDYRSIFSSPYFDYRRTHSKVRKGERQGCVIGNRRDFAAWRRL